MNTIHCYYCSLIKSVPDGSVGKESACRAGDPGSILGLRRSSGERKGYPLQYSWASLVAQLKKNPPAMRKTWVWSLSWEDPLEKGKATHSSILAWRIPWTVESMGHKESDTTEGLSLHYWVYHMYIHELINMFLVSCGWTRGWYTERV